MSNSLFQVFAAMLMLGVAAILFVAIRNYMRANSERRMTSMLKRVGVDPSIAATGDSTQIIKDIRKRCRMCTTEDVCERWLAGEVQGDNEFCPNASVFETLRQTPAH